MSRGRRGPLRCGRTRVHEEWVTLTLTDLSVLEAVKG